MDLPSHADVVAKIDAFLIRHDMAPSRFGRDALGEAQFVSEVRAGRQPNLPTLRKVSDFMRDLDEALAESLMTAQCKTTRAASHRLNAGGR